MAEPLVWLPFDPSRLGDPPDGLRYEGVDPTEHVPDSVADVRFYVPPYAVGPAGRGGAAPDDQPRGRADAHGRRRQHPRHGPRRGHPLQRPRHPRHLHRRARADPDPGVPARHPGFVRAQDRHDVGVRLAPRARRQAGAARRVRRDRARRSSAGCCPSRSRWSGSPAAPATASTAIDELPDLLPDADVVVLLVPLTDETRGLVDAGFLARMKDGALLVNVARGAVVDTDDLVAALATGRISAAVDVADPEPLPAGQPALDRAQPADLAARRRRQQRDVAPGQPAGPRPAAPVRRRRAACANVMSGDY